MFCCKMRKGKEQAYAVERVKDGRAHPAGHAAGTGHFFCRDWERETASRLSLVDSLSVQKMPVAAPRQTGKREGTGIYPRPRQRSTGASPSLLAEGRAVRFPFPAKKIPLIPSGIRGILERMTGIEPATDAWEASVLPLNHIRVSLAYLLYSIWRKKARGKFSGIFAKTGVFPLVRKAGTGVE